MTDDIVQYEPPVDRAPSSSPLIEWAEGANAALLGALIGYHPKRVHAADTLERLRDGEPVVVIATPQRIEAIAPIDRDAGLYLYVARTSEFNALSQWESAQSVLGEYEVVTERARRQQLLFNVALFVTSLTLVVGVVGLLGGVVYTAVGSFPPFLTDDPAVAEAGVIG